MLISIDCFDQIAKKSSNYALIGQVNDKQKMIISIGVKISFVGQ